MIPAGFAPGGAAYFAGLLSHHLGQPTNILTAWGNDFQFAPQFEGIDLHVVPSPETTVFENIYQPDGHRIQYLHSRATQLYPKDLPSNWQAPKTALFGPICDEVSFEFLDFFASQNTITCACPQGWMRQWDDGHRVSPKPIADWSVLAKADVISMSEADVAGDWGLIAHIASLANILLVTQGANGVVVFEKGKPRRQFPARQVVEVNPTGAGDVFAASFLLHFSETGDVANAVDWAQGVAGEHVAHSNH